MQNLLSGVLAVIIALVSMCGGLTSSNVSNPVTVEFSIGLDGDLSSVGASGIPVDTVKSMLNDISFRISADPANVAQLQVLLGGEPAASLSVKQTEDVWAAVSSLFPNTVVNVKNETISGMMGQMMGSGSGNMIASLQEQLTPELLEAISAPIEEAASELASKVGPVEEGTFEVNGVTYTQKTPWNITTKEAGLVILGAAKKIAADEKVAGLLGQFGLTDAAAKIDEAYAQFEAASEEDQPVLTAAQYANDEGACVEIIMAKDEESISFVGARAGQVLTMDLSAMGMLEAGLKLDEAAKTLDLSAKFVSDGSVVDLTLAAAGGEQGGTATVAANVKSGETAVALKLNCKVTADAPVFEAADGLAVFDLDNATEESAAAFQQDLQVGLGTVMGVVMQKYPEIMQLMQSAPSESAPAEPESEVPAA